MPPTIGKLLLPDPRGLDMLAILRGQGTLRKSLALTPALISQPLLQTTLFVDLAERERLRQSRIGLQRQHGSSTLDPAPKLGDRILARQISIEVIGEGAPPTDGYLHAEPPHATATNLRAEEGDESSSAWTSTINVPQHIGTNYEPGRHAMSSM
ncbi:hypothetical protein ACIBG0_34965 [Nocardia sp. NPDC050630]|uniref:hypothetical protein n=1 Tax=Nocardia sp. NPDC050630 TaxID=3364321 RepID=UPI0037952618